MNRSRLVVYDTSNFVDYPVGGQLTSISNFLHYVCETETAHIKDILLVGVSGKQENVGKISSVEVGGHKISFIPVTLAESDLNHVKHSLRISYVKGIRRYRKQLALKSSDCHYVNTPEAFGAVRSIVHGADIFIFSHGSFLNLTRDARFFRRSKLIRQAADMYFRDIIRKCRCVFVLDRDTLNEYSRYTDRAILVGNSIVCQEKTNRPHLAGRTIRCMYAGRLSANKRIGVIAQAVNDYPGDIHLTIAGAGETDEELRKLCTDRITMTGALTPDRVHELMKDNDILIMNSEREGIPMAILEAESYGMPIVTTDVGGIGDVTDYGKDSEKTDGTKDGIIDAISRIAGDYEDYSRSSWEHSKDFDYHKVNGKIMQELNKKLCW